MGITGSSGSCHCLTRPRTCDAWRSFTSLDSSARPYGMSVARITYHATKDVGTDSTDRISHPFDWPSSRIAIILLVLSVSLRAQLPNSVTIPTTNVDSGNYSYQAGTSITANNFTVNASAPQTANVVFHAGSSIILNPGFYAKAVNGTAFTAYVNPAFNSGSVSTGSASAYQPETISFNIAPPSGYSIAGGDIYLQAFDNNGNLLHQCPVSFTANPAVVGMSDSGQQMPLPGVSPISNLNQTTGVSECTINPSGTSIGTPSSSVTVNLNMTFMAGAVGTYYISADTFDSSGNLSPLEYVGTLTVSISTPIITMTTNPTVLAADVGHSASFAATFTRLYGELSPCNSPCTVSLVATGTWPGTPVFSSNPVTLTPRTEVILVRPSP